LVQTFTIGCMRGNSYGCHGTFSMCVLGPLLTLLAIVPMASAAVTAVVCMMVAARLLKLYSRDGESDGHSHRRDILAHEELSAHQARHAA
jgi:hypothetical protein